VFSRRILNPEHAVLASEHLMLPVASGSTWLECSEVISVDVGIS